MNIPNDPAILLSYINTKLRDDFPDLTELCKTLDVDQEALTKKLASIGYDYNKDLNRFM